MTHHSFIDLYAGCGGFSHGLEKEKFKGKLAVEIDKNCCETYSKNLKTKIICEDIRSIKDKDIPNSDIIVGGFPCQPFSLSGLQNGFNDETGGDLFNQCLRFIKKSNPKIFLLENVTGFISLKKGYYLNLAIKKLTKLGYHVDYKILNTKNFSIPQNRKRLFIMGNKIGVNNMYPKEDLKKIISVKESIEEIKKNPNKYFNNDPMKHTDRIKRRFNAVKPGETSTDAMKRDPSLGTAKISKQCYRRLKPNEPAPTVVANFVTTTIHYSEDRNLTAREAARIQSFPDNFIFEGYKTRMSWQKDLSQFEQIGNAVPPKISLLFARQFKKMLNKKPFSEKLNNITNYNLELFNNLPVDNKKIEIKTVKSRGRTSKYIKDYEKIEKLKKNMKLRIINDSAFEMFLAGAMRRRNISYSIITEGNKKFLLRK